MEQSFLFTHRNDLYLLTKDNRYYSRDNSYKGVHGGSIAHLPSLSVVAGCRPEVQAPGIVGRLFGGIAPEGIVSFSGGALSKSAVHDQGPATGRSRISRRADND
ncbi:hypothetical protein D3C84_261680 [compost metagenome]